MRTFPSGFEAEKNKKSTAPVWILKFNFGGTDLYVSDKTFTINTTTWQNITTKAWVKQWGRLFQQVTGDINEISVSEFFVTMINDTNVTQNLEYYLENTIPEQNPAELYCWFHGISEDPQLMWKGYIRDYEFQDDYTIFLSLIDETVKLQKYIGTKATKDDYPDIDPDDVGRVIPIVYGGVEKLPAVCVKAGAISTLPNDIGKTDTTIKLSDASSFPYYGTIYIEDEIITYTSISGDTLQGVTRGANGTTATSHAKGAVVWQGMNEIVYLVADHTGTIGKVYAEKDGYVIDVTADCTKYNGTHPDYPGKAVVTFPDFPKVYEKIQLQINDTIDVDDQIGVQDDINVSSASKESISKLSTNTPVSLQWSYGGSSSQQKNIQFPTNPGGNGQSDWRISYSFSFDIPEPGYLTGASDYIDFYIDGTKVARLDNSGFHQYVGSPMIKTYTGWKTAITFSYVASVAYNPGFAVTFTIQQAEEHMTRNIEITKTGSAFKTGQATKVGTVTLEGNSVANTFIGKRVLVDFSGKSDDPLASSGPFRDILSQCGWTGSFSGENPDGIYLQGAITEYRRAIDWLKYFAFQMKSFIVVSNSVVKLIPYDRESVADSVRAIRMDDTGVRILKRRQTNLRELINKIQLHHSRDWTKPSRGNDSYFHVDTFNDTSSISNFGERQRPELFFFDFIKSTIHASKVGDYYIGRFANRKWKYEFECFLDYLHLEVGDLVDLSPLNIPKIVEILSVEYNPGSIHHIDLIKMITQEIANVKTSGNFSDDFCDGVIDPFWGAVTSGATESSCLMSIYNDTDTYVESKEFVNGDFEAKISLKNIYYDSAGDEDYRYYLWFGNKDSNGRFNGIGIALEVDYDNGNWTKKMVMINGEPGERLNNNPSALIGQQSITSANPDINLKLVKQNNTITCSFSENGTNYTTLGSVSYQKSGKIRFGMAMVWGNMFDGGVDFYEFSLNFI